MAANVESVVFREIWVEIYRRSLSLPRTTMLCIMVYWGFAGQTSNGSFCRFELCRLVEIEALEDFQSDAMVQQKVMAIVYFYIEIDSCEKL